MKTVWSHVVITSVTITMWKGLVRFMNTSCGLFTFCAARQPKETPVLLHMTGWQNARKWHDSNMTYEAGSWSAQLVWGCSWCCMGYGLVLIYVVHTLQFITDISDNHTFFSALKAACQVKKLVISFAGISYVNWLQFCIAWCVPWLP